MSNTRVPLIGLLAVAGLVVACGDVSRLRTRCLSGEVAACTQLGEMYATGRGVEVDLSRAAEMYARACEGGAADVCNTLGEIYEKTAGLEGGMERAAAMFERACALGSAAGCLNLGLTFAAREDVPRAIALYDRSCAGGWAAGCHQLGVVYEQGEGVAKDVTRALAYYAQGCDGEFIDSCVNAGSLYLAAEPRDIASATQSYGRAIKLLDEGCASGAERDCAERDRLRTRLAIAAATR
jgi:TPR repeat protein